tara:strand:- start:2711 stop:3520 length:810 start_codon:yes stop_codon:yes gene_type:complete
LAEVSHPLRSSEIFANAARTGLAARAVVYWLIAGLMIRAAWRPGADEEGFSPGDAFRSLETQPAGQIILVTIGLGLLTYAVWRFLQAGLDVREKGQDPTGILARVGMAMSGLTYATIGVASIAVIFGDNQGGGPGATEATARFLLDQPFGRFAVALFGFALVFIGGAQIWRVLEGKWRDGLEVSGWRTRLIPIIQISIAGRGALFQLVGLFLLLSAWTQDPGDVKGLSAALGWLRDQPFGVWLYAIGAGFIGGYGVYSATQARCLKFDC